MSCDKPGAFSRSVCIADLLQTLRIADVLDVCVVSVLVYAGLRWLLRRTSRAVAVGVILVGTLYVTAHVLEMYLTLSSFRIGLTVILLTLVIVFQQDIRLALEQLSAWRIFAGDRGGASEQTTDTLTEAATMLAKERIGALLVIQGRQPVQTHVRGGVPVGGRISIPILHSIFHPATQGHDGAVVIHGDVIEKLGVHLPLSKNLDAVGRSGTRHAAALGLVERCDALVIVVSEERGTISIAEQAGIQPLQSHGELKERLDRFYGSNLPELNGERRANWLTANLGLKLLAAATACGLWFLFAYDVETIRRTFREVPIELRNVPDGWVVRETSSSEAQVTLNGSERAFSAFNPADLKASINLSSVRGSADIPLTEEHFELPAGIALEQLDPAAIQVTTEPLVSVVLPVRIAFAEAATPPPDLVARCEPPQLRILIPHSARDSLQEVSTEPIDRQSISKGQNVERSVLLPPGGKLPAGSSAKVTVSFHARPTAQP